MALFFSPLYSMSIFIPFLVYIYVLYFFSGIKITDIRWTKQINSTFIKMCTDWYIYSLIFFFFIKAIFIPYILIVFFSLPQLLPNLSISLPTQLQISLLPNKNKNKKPTNQKKKPNYVLPKCCYKYYKHNSYSSPCFVSTARAAGPDGILCLIFSRANTLLLIVAAALSQASHIVFRVL